MKNILKIPQVTKTLPKFYFNLHNLLVRNVSCEGGINNKTVNDDLEHFPEKNHLIREEYNIKKEEESYQKFLVNELLTECGLNETSFPLHGIEKEFVMTVDIGILKKVGILINDTHITEKLLSYIEPFPFSNNEKTSIPWKVKKFTQSEKFITIKGIRDFIETEYLAWKFKVDVELIKKTLICFRSCLFPGRSLRNVKRNWDLINEVPQVQNQSLASKIFLMNMRPFNIETLLNFKDNFFGYEWDDAANTFPALMRKPYPCILMFVRVLESKGFSQCQIKKALPFLRINLISLLKRLNCLLSSPSLSNFQSDSEFLRLLFFHHKTLSNLIDTNQKSYLELLSFIDVDVKNGPRKFSMQELHYQLSKKFKINEAQLKVLQRHPKLLLTSETQISDTIKFLKEFKFENEEIIESIAIVLYPRENIKKALAQLIKKEEALQKVGFQCGCVPEETNFFQFGTKLKRKTLQLCLYYMEKNHNFSGKGILLPQDQPDLNCDLSFELKRE